MSHIVKSQKAALKLRNYYTDEKRKVILKNLMKLEDEHHLMFKRMYSHKNLDASLKDVVYTMPEKHLDLALEQVYYTMFQIEDERKEKRKESINKIKNLFNITGYRK